MKGNGEFLYTRRFQLIGSYFYAQWLPYILETKIGYKDLDGNKIYQHQGTCDVVLMHSLFRVTSVHVSLSCEVDILKYNISRNNSTCRIAYE